MAPQSRNSSVVVTCEPRANESPAATVGMTTTKTTAASSSKVTKSIWHSQKLTEL